MQTNPIDYKTTINNLPCGFMQMFYPYVIFHSSQESFQPQLYLLQPIVQTSLSCDPTQYHLDVPNDEIKCESSMLMQPQHHSNEENQQLVNQDEKNSGTLRSIKKIYQKEKKNKQNEGKKFNKGRWTQKEQLFYERFLIKHDSMMSDPDKKKQQKIFLMMSSYIKTRSPDQCRSHHQKFSNSLDEDISQ